MKNENKKPAENINNDNGKLLLSDVSNSVCPQCGKGKAPKEYTCFKCYLKRLKQTDC